VRNFSIPLIIFTFFILLSQSPAYAQSGPCPQGFEILCSMSNPASYENFFSNIIQVLFIVAVVVSLIFLIWGGIRWIKSGGDKAQIDQARSTIIGAMIGLAISLSAYFIVHVIYYIVTGNNQLNLPIPKLV
jgi:hypothetical protein